MALQIGQNGLNTLYPDTKCFLRRPDGTSGDFPPPYETFFWLFEDGDIAEFENGNLAIQENAPE